MSDQATRGETDGRLILLDAADNVLVLRSRIAQGETIAVEGRLVVAGRDLPIGHKIARCDIEAGDKILKYGAPIGRATAAIARGRHVHVHNVASDYTPTYHLGGTYEDRAKA